ncbi:protein FAM13A [Rhynchophorus ferrugineus]|uniref:protein FAM13A n=1 Tax=Rhynchophorus ferrugineus TaxID=354439 RepID=UPI003FCD4A0A
MKGSVPKEEPQKCVAKIEQEHKICKVKKISLPVWSKTQNQPNTFDEAKTNKARKRKERQESVSSLCQERKVIRSNSEERPQPTTYPDNKNNSIRRVSSSGDFPKTNSEEKINGSPNKIVLADKSLMYDDHEHERRRSHERFARPHTLKNKKYPGKRFKVRCASKVKVKSELYPEREAGKKTNDCDQFSQITSEYKDQDLLSATQFLNLRTVEAERSPSPIHTPISPVLDFSTLHEQIDCNEPVLSRPSYEVEDTTETLPSLSIASNRLLSSPRNSIIATHRIYLDPDVPQTNVALEKNVQNPIEGRIQKITKHINSYKKKIKIYEAEFEAKNGYKPTQVDKLNDSMLRKYYTELSKLKKEQKQLSDLSANCPLGFNIKVPPIGKSTSLQDTVNEIEQKLSQKRESGNRSFDIETMTPEQLLEEKIAVQKALLFLESIHGRPQAKEDRDIVRPFYDRYRILKRMVAKISASGTVGELATIHENETMHFVTPTSSSNDTESEQTELIPSTPITTSNNTDSENETSLSEKLHSLSKTELAEQLKVTAEEKKVLRRKIKEFEFSIQAKSIKMLSKEERAPIEHIYTAYKATKGRLKLLEALVSKK